MTELAQKLDEFIGEEYAEAIKESFTIDTADKADWALRKIAKYQGAIDEAKELAAKRTQQITAWLTAIEEDNQKQISFFENLLEPYAKKQIEGQKKKSVKLPTGTFGFKAQQPKFELMEDGKTITAWAEKNAPDYIKKDPELKWGEFKKTITTTKITENEIEKTIAVDANGERIPGLTVEEQPDKFYVKVG